MRMKSSAFGRWIGALVLCAILVALCVQFVDRPVALFANAHLAAKNSLATSLDLVLLFVPLGALTILGCGCTVLAARSLPRLAETTMLAGFSLMWALASTTYLLKPAFGRIEIATYLAHPISTASSRFMAIRTRGFPPVIWLSQRLSCWVLGFLPARPGKTSPQNAQLHEASIGEGG
jgi:hypothetical protein